MTLTVADVMTTPVFSLSPDTTLHHAHSVTREKGIRHLPIVDPKSDKLVGIVTQKSLIAKVFGLMATYGGAKLAEHEADTNIMEVALTDFDTVKASDDVKSVASFFLQNKHGCLPVVDEEHRVIGMLTSSDFVKLAIKLLAE
ncbi:HPP family protein [Alteromonas facilis]|uniref:CBS domain-containing protein n=1 Tax=Alteromonas facilis TaxID=2048004 RepID=UPI000C294C51|nr:CBS domain-containing protein [Alteromonas facilis]